MNEVIPAEDAQAALDAVLGDIATPWRYGALAPDGSVTLAQSATEMVSDFIEGYSDLDDDTALERRYDLLVWLGGATQQHYVNLAEAAGTLTEDDADEDILTALFSDRSKPREDGDWDHEVPLVLVATDYSPYTKRAKPRGKIVWINPETEVTFLRSLETLGMIRLVIF